MASDSHNPVKLPLLVACSVIIAIAVIVWVANGNWLLAALGVVVIAMSLLAVRTIRQGRNPWWLRAPLDRRRPHGPAD